MDRPREPFMLSPEAWFYAYCHVWGVKAGWIGEDVRVALNGYQPGLGDEYDAHVVDTFLEMLGNE